MLRKCKNIIEIAFSDCNFIFNGAKYGLLKTFFMIRVLFNGSI